MLNEYLTVVLASVGGTAVIVIGLASWLGKTIASRILIREQEKIDINLEKIKSNLSTLTHKSNSQISNYSLRSSDAIEEVYCELIDFFKYFENEFSIISQQLKEIRNNSMEEIEDFDHKIASGELMPVGENYVPTAHMSFMANLMKFTYKKGIDWTEKSREFHYFLSKKEIYMDKKLSDIVFETAEKVSKISIDAIKMNAELGIEAGSNGTHMAKIENIDSKSEDIIEQFNELIVPAKLLLIAEIKKQLTPPIDDSNS